MPELPFVDANEQLTRGDVLMEMLNRIENAIIYARKNNMKQQLQELEIGHRVIRTLYRTQELSDLKWLEHISK